FRWEELRVSIAGEEERWICGAQKEDVVVEVDVSFAESGNVMKLRLYGMRVEHRQSIAVGEDLSVVDDSDLRILGIQPGRHLPIGDDKDVVDPAGIGLDRAQRILELVPAGEPRRDRGGLV